MQTFRVQIEGSRSREKSSGLGGIREIDLFEGRKRGRENELAGAPHLRHWMEGTEKQLITFASRDYLSALKRREGGEGKGRTHTLPYIRITFSGSRTRFVVTSAAPSSPGRGEGEALTHCAREILPQLKLPAGE